MNRTHRVHAGGRGLAAALAALLLSGCVSSRYAAADQDPLPPIALNLKSAPLRSEPEPPPPEPAIRATAPAEVTLHHLITMHGPGSWKRDAFWDEYVVSIVNRGPTPVTITSARLTDLRGDTTAPGDDPWALEKQSRSRVAELNQAAKTTLVHVGTSAAVAGGSAIVAVGAAAAPIVAVPVYLTGAYVKNQHGRRAVETGFARRRLALPVTIAPREGAQGSLFFRISPGPKQLALQGHAGDGGVHDAVIDLAPLAGLHLKGSKNPRDER